MNKEDKADNKSSKLADDEESKDEASLLGKTKYSQYFEIKHTGKLTPNLADYEGIEGE